MKLLKSIDRYVGKIINFLGLASMSLLFVILLANVLIRFLHIPIPMSWYSEVVEILFAWMVMIGAVILCRKADHFRVDLFLQKFGTRRGYYWLEVFCQAVALVFYIYFLYFGFNLTVNAPQTMPILKIPKGIAYACMPICALMMCAYALKDVCVALGRATGKIALPEIK